MAKIWLGIDPGLDGAVAAITGTGVAFIDTPTVTVKVGAKLKRQIDPHGCAVLLKKFKPESGDELMVVIEKVAPMPSFGRNKDTGAPEGERTVTMGVTSAFNFGWGLGVWIGVCSGLELPFQLVHALTWKRRMMADMGKEKDASRVKAMQLYPHIAPELSRKKDHNRADALLLARFGQMTYAPATIERPVPATLFE